MTNRLLRAFAVSPHRRRDGPGDRPGGASGVGAEVFGEPAGAVGVVAREREHLGAAVARRGVPGGHHLKGAAGIREAHRERAAAHDGVVGGLQLAAPT